MAADTRSTFGELLRRYRAAAGLTQEELAERAGLSARGIADLERGARTAPYARTVRKLAEVLRLGVDEHAALLSARARAEAAQREPGFATGEHELPVPPTALIGREHAVDILIQRLLRDRVRLLTLTGTGGTGKTRLALAVAVAVRASFQHSVWFVDLVTIREPELVLPAIARVLGVRDSARRSIAEGLQHFLRGKRALLILDNCEQVATAAADIADLLQRCPETQVLATSREPLRLRSERLFLVPPLGLPPAGVSLGLDELSATPAVKLFVQRAQDVQPAFDLAEDTAGPVVELCRRMDGLPLAIELAAARVAVLPPAALLTRMDQRLDLLRASTRDAPARHQTLRAAIDWSHDMLPEAEKAIFKRLAIFLGGCTLDAAEQVCQLRDTRRIDVLDSLEALTAKGLITSQDADGQPRFGMLETIHEYALDALEDGGEAAAVRQSHALYYLRFAERTQPLLHGADQLSWFRHLDREFANFRAALLWFTQQFDEDALEAGLRLASALFFYMHVRGEHAQLRQFLAPFLSTAVRPTAGRAWGLRTDAACAWALGDQGAAEALIEDSLALMRQLNDRRGEAHALMSIGLFSMTAGNADRASAAFAESLAIAQDNRDDWAIATTLSLWSGLAVAQRDLSTARALLEAALTIQRKIGDAFGIALSVNGLAALARLDGQPDRGQPLYEESLRLFRALGERPNVAAVLESLGELALAERDFLTARQRFQESLATYREMDSARGVGVALSGLATLAAAEGQHARALRLAGAAAALVEASGVSFEVFGHQSTESWLAAAQLALGEAAADVASAQGRAMSLDAAVTWALAVEEDTLLTDDSRWRAAAGRQ